MAKNDQEEVLDRVLTSNLARVIDFLKFAETKGAALLTFSSVWALGLLSLQASTLQFHSIYLHAFRVMALFFMLSAATAVASFISRTQLAIFLHLSSEEKRPPNLLFFGDLARIPLGDLQAELASRYTPAEGRSVSDSYIHDVSVQIGVVSQIAQRKFDLFNAGAVFVFAAFSTLVIATGWYMVTQLKS